MDHRILGRQGRVQLLEYRREEAVPDRGAGEAFRVVREGVVLW